MKKTYMFQYATKSKMYEDTGLITLAEALELWHKYLPQVIKQVEENDTPQMAIWEDCANETDYSKEYKIIDYYDDLSVKNGIIYKNVRADI